MRTSGGLPRRISRVLLGGPVVAAAAEAAPGALPPATGAFPEAAPGALPLPQEHFRHPLEEDFRLPRDEDMRRPGTKTSGTLGRRTSGAPRRKVSDAVLMRTSGTSGSHRKNPGRLRRRTGGFRSISGRPGRSSGAHLMILEVSALL